MLLMCGSICLEPLVLGLQLNKQEPYVHADSEANSSQALTGVVLLRIINSSYPSLILLITVIEEK